MFKRFVILRSLIIRDCANTRLTWAHLGASIATCAFITGQIFKPDFAANTATRPEEDKTRIQQKQRQLKKHKEGVNFTEDRLLSGLRLISAFEFFT